MPKIRECGVVRRRSGTAPREPRRETHTSRMRCPSGRLRRHPLARLADMAYDTELADRIRFLIGTGPGPRLPVECLARASKVARIMTCTTPESVRCLDTR